MIFTTTLNKGAYINLLKKSPNSLSLINKAINMPVGKTFTSALNVTFPN